MDYCNIEAGQITYGPGGLPTNWGRISNLPALSATELLGHGWLPVVDVKPDLGARQAYAGPTLAVEPTRVVRTYAVVDLLPPTVVTMRQARLALHAAGRLAAVQAALAALPEPDRTAAEIEWEYAQTVERGSALVALLAAAVPLTAAEIDALFIAAEAY